MTIADQVLSALDGYGLKKEGTDQWRCNNPFRPGADGHSFTLKLEGDDKGAWYDHRDNEGGSLFDLAKRLGIEVESGKPVPTTKREYRGLKDYAHAHGVPPEVLLNAGWREDKYKGRPALKFPTRSGDRWRFLDGQQPNYISTIGYKKCWYGFNEPLGGMLGLGADLVICNGEISTVVAQSYGLAAVAVTSGEGAIPTDLIGELQRLMQPYATARIIIALDCDAKGRAAADAMHKQLITAGFGSTQIVDLGLSKGGDLADWLTLYGWESQGQAVVDFGELKRLTPYVHTPRKRFTIMHASELGNLPQTAWLIKGMIPDNGITIIYGASGVGKSFVSLDYALRIAQQQPVVYVAGEGESGYWGRINAWTNHYMRPMGQLWMCLGSVSLLDEGDVEGFAREVSDKVKHPRLIIIDTLARAMLGGDENSSRDMGQFIDKCDMLRQRFGCAVVIVHHTNKTGIYERGSNALRGAADSMIRISDDDDIIVIESAKSKDSAPFETIYKKLRPIDVGQRDEHGDPVMAMVIVDADPDLQTDVDGLTRNQRKVLIAAGNISEFGFSIIELSEALPEIGRKSLYNITSRLRKMGYLKQEAKREPFVLTDKGQKLLDVTDVSNVSNVSVVSANSGYTNSPQKVETQPTQPTHSTQTTQDGWMHGVQGRKEKSYHGEGM